MCAKLQVCSLIGSRDNTCQSFLDCRTVGLPEPQTAGQFAGLSQLHWKKIEIHKQTCTPYSYKATIQMSTFEHLSNAEN